jgi:hypothetical protein
MAKEPSSALSENVRTNKAAITTASTNTAVVPHAASEAGVTGEVVPQPLWLRIGAAAGFAAFAVLAVIDAVGIVLESYSPVPWADMWNELPFVRRTLEGHFSWAGLWAQHNEHRIVLSRLEFLLDFGLFGGREIFLLAMVFLSCVVLALVLAWPAFRIWRDPVVRLGFLSFAIAAVLTPADWENLTWGFQVGFVQVIVFAVIAINVLALARFASPLGARDGVLLASIALSGTAATYSNANGMLVWPVLVFIALRRRLSVRAIAAISAIGAVEIIAYLWHFKPVPQHTPYSTSLRHPLGVADYVATYLGHPAQPLGLDATRALGCVGLCVFAGIIVAALRSRERLVLLSGAGVSIFAVLTAGETAIGRLNFGIAEALSSRYSITAAVFWVSLMVAASELIAGSTVLRVGRRRPLDVTALAFVTGCLLLVFSAGFASRQIPDASGIVRNRQFFVGFRANADTVAAAYSAGLANSSVLATVLAPPYAPVDLHWMETNHLGPWSSALLRRVSSRAQRLDLKRLPTCGGHVDDSSAIPGGERYEGWIVTPSHKGSLSYLEIVGPGGRNKGVGYEGLYRPDVQAAGQSTTDDSGFVAFGREPVSPSEKLVMFGAGAPACALSVGAS